MDSPIRIGALVAAHGIHGDLLLEHGLGGPTDFPGVEAFLLGKTPDTLIPYFPVSMKARSASETLLRLEGVDTREKALALLKRDVWLPDPIARRLASGNAPLQLLDYRVIDGDRDLGPILEVIPMPAQDLLRLEIDGREVLIPLHQETLRRIDHQGRRLYVELPDGLLVVYLS